jgi:hypothetical protein
MKKQDRPGSKSRQAIGPLPGEGTLSSAARAVRPSIAAHGWGRALINAFILWHLFALAIWLMPASAIWQTCIDWVRPYITFTGFMPTWSMFAPTPPSRDFYVEARITYANGQLRSWKYPRVGDPGPLDWYRNERFYKLIENGQLEENRMVWPSLARYAAQRNNIYPHNPPVSAALVRYFVDVPPPGAPFPPYHTYVFYETPILPQDLR